MQNRRFCLDTNERAGIMKHEDDDQDVLYESGPIKAGTAVCASNPGGIVRYGRLQGYRGGVAQVRWVDSAFAPGRWHVGSFVEVTELDVDLPLRTEVALGLLGFAGREGEAS